METLKSILTQRPLFLLIAAGIGLAKLSISGVDIKPLVSAAVDEVVPAIGE